MADALEERGHPAATAIRARWSRRRAHGKGDSAGIEAPITRLSIFGGLLAANEARIGEERGDGFDAMYGDVEVLLDGAFSEFSEEDQAAFRPWELFEALFRGGYMRRIYGVNIVSTEAPIGDAR